MKLPKILKTNAGKTTKKRKKSVEEHTHKLRKFSDKTVFFSLSLSLLLVNFLERSLSENSNTVPPQKTFKCAVAFNNIP